MGLHTRLYVRIAGECSGDYFVRATELAKRLADKSKANLVGYDLRNKPGKGIVELVTDSERLHQEMATRLKELDPSKDVTAGRETVDPDNLASNN